MGIQAIFDQFRQSTDDVSAAILTLATILKGENDKPLSVKQAAERLNVAPCTIYGLCDAGKLPHKRVGKGRGTIRIRPADLELLADKTVSLQSLIR